MRGILVLSPMVDTITEYISRSTDHLLPNHQVLNMGRPCPLAEDAMRMAQTSEMMVKFRKDYARFLADISHASGLDDPFEYLADTLFCEVRHLV